MACGGAVASMASMARGATPTPSPRPYAITATASLTDRARRSKVNRGTEPHSHRQSTSERKIAPARQLLVLVVPQDRLQGPVPRDERYVQPREVRAPPYRRDGPGYNYTCPLPKTTFEQREVDQRN